MVLGPVMDVEMGGYLRLNFLLGVVCHYDLGSNLGDGCLHLGNGEVFV